MRPPQLPAAVEAVRALPELRFVLDHAGKPDLTTAPDERWLRALDDLAGCEHLTVKLSGLTSEAPDDWTPRSSRSRS